MNPVLGEDGHYVRVGDQDDGGERGVAAPPGDDEDRLPSDTLLGSVGEPEGLGLLHQELNDLVVVRAGLN